jgi:hypothetical protein
MMTDCTLYIPQQTIFEYDHFNNPDDEMQVMVVALAAKLNGDHDRTSGWVSHQHSKVSYEDEVFNMDNMVAASSSNRRGKQVS